MAELGEANIGGRMVPAWLLNLTAEELDSLKSRWYSNPNLLDNWYFGNPINQRGKTEYTDSWAYSIDRWLCGGDGKVTIADGHCVFYGAVDQGLSVEMSDILGCTMTASLLLTDGTLITGTAVNTDNSLDIPFVRGVGGVFLGLNDTDLSKHRRFRIYMAPERAVIAAKLELGSQQTLAHQENGVWVLNEIPDYGEQLRRCQRYQRKIFISMLTATYVWNQTIQFSLNDVLNGMRATPALTLFGKQMDTAVSSTDGLMAVIPGGNGDSGWDISAGTTYSLLVENNSIIIKAIIPESKFTVTSNSGLNYALHCGEGVYIFADANL